MHTVTLRTKPIQDNKLRLYLDYYPAIIHPDTGTQTRRDFLKIFLYSELAYKEEVNKSGKRTCFVPDLDKNNIQKKLRLNPDQRKHNKEQMEVAELIRSQRHLQIQANDYGFLLKDTNADFLSFFKDIADKRKKEKDDTNYIGVYNYLNKFSNGVCSANKLTDKFCADFRDYLSSPHVLKSGRTATLTNNSVIVYFAIFNTVIKQAVKKNLLSENPAIDVSKPKRVSGKQRDYLTMDELNAVVATPCDLPTLKSAALFSALTGLRFSDIIKLTWGEVVKENNDYTIKFVTKKTKQAETLPISEQAASLLGERRNAPDKVFPDLKYGPWQNSVLDRWVRKAGITKHITFHCFRHTFATLQITFGTDIYTVSKMLGHRDISTTQIYAKIIDQKKRTAADKIMLTL